MFLEQLVYQNSGKFISQTEAYETFSHRSKFTGVSGKLYYLVSAVEKKQKYIYFENVPRKFNRHVEHLDLMYTGHDWSCLLETEILHKFCVDVDCGCCKKIPGKNRITNPIEFIRQMIDYIHNAFKVPRNVMECSYTMTTGSSHGFHVIFNNFVVDHFSYRQVLSKCMEEIKTNCIIDIPECFPIGYGRGHVTIVKYQYGKEVNEFSYEDLCPYVDVVPGLDFYHFKFNNDTWTDGMKKISDIPLKRKIIKESLSINSTVGDVGKINVEFANLNHCRNPFLYYNEYYLKYILPFSLSGHEKFSTQRQQFLNLPTTLHNLPTTLQKDNLPATIQKDNLPATIQKDNIPATIQKDNLPATIQKDNLPATIQKNFQNLSQDDEMDIDDDLQSIQSVEFGSNILPEINYESYITDGYEITNRKGPEFVSYRPETQKRIEKEYRLDADYDSDVDDIDDYKTLKEQDYDPSNKFENFYNINKYTDPRVYDGHVIDRAEWLGILEHYYKRHMDNQYTMAIFGYVLGVYGGDDTAVNETFGVCDYDDLKNLEPCTIVSMLIVHSMIFGRQVIGIISDLCTASIEYTNGRDDDMDTDADADFIDDMDAAPIKRIENKSKSTWNQICASMIKYSWEFMERRELEARRKLFPKKIHIIIKFLYVYNHNSDIAMQNMISEFNCKCAMVSNIFDSAVSKYLTAVNADFDHYRPYEMLQRLKLEESGVKMIDFVVKYFWKPFEMTGAVYVYAMTKFTEIIPEQFAGYVSENCNKKIRSKLCLAVNSNAVPPFTQYHARQFIYNTNCPNNMHGTFWKNTILNDFENTNGCVQTFMVRNYPNVGYLMGRFKPEIYNIVVDCLNAIQEIDYEIKMSGVKLLFVRPIVPLAFESFNVFGHNTCALSVKDYRQVLSNVDVNVSRLNLLYHHYTNVNPSNLTTDAERIFYYTYLWFSELVTVLLNSDVYENSDMNIDVIVSVLFGDNTLQQLGLDNDDDDQSVEICESSHDKLPTVDFSDSDNNKNIIDKRIVFDFEKYSSSHDYMLNVHNLRIDVTEFSRPDEDADPLSTVVSKFEYSDSLTELKPTKKTTIKSDNIIDDKITKIKYKMIKIKTKKILNKIQSSNASAINNILISALVDRDDSWTSGENFQIYTKNLQNMSPHNRMLLTIVTLHAMKRLYHTRSECFVHAEIRKIVTNPDIRYGIFKWLIDHRSLHNTIWRYDFFTGPRNKHREITLYRYIEQHPEKFKHCASESKKSQKFTQYIDIIAYSMMYAFILCENDFKKMIFLFKNMLNDEFPGQTIKKCIIVTGESNSGKTSFIDNVYMKYLSSSSSTNANKKSGDNAPEKSSYARNFVLYEDDKEKIEGEFLKPFISTAKMSFRKNLGNNYSEICPLSHLIMTNNNTRITGADSAVYKRIMVFAMNCVYGNCVNKFICQYLYLTRDDRCILYNTHAICSGGVSYEKFTISDDNLTIPYLFTNLHDKQYINSEINVTKIIEGWQLITTYFSWYKFFKHINNPAAIYEHSLPQSMKNDYVKWLMTVSPFMRWKHQVECIKITSPGAGEVGMPWNVIQRNLEEFARIEGGSINDICSEFVREFKKYHNPINDTYNIKVNELKFKNIVTKIKKK